MASVIKRRAYYFRIEDIIPRVSGVLKPRGMGVRSFFAIFKIGHSRTFPEMIERVGPQTPYGTPSGDSVQRLCETYGGGAARDQKSRREKFYFLNGISWERALVWAREFGLDTVDAYTLVAVGIKCRRFDKQVDMNDAYLLSTKELVFEGSPRLLAVSWHETAGKVKTRVSLEFPETRDDPNFWYVFRKTIK